MAISEKPYASAVKCSSCKGHGKRSKKEWNGKWSVRTCSRCFGTGWTGAPAAPKAEG